MLVKSFEVDKVNLDKNKIILMHGKNDGLKNEIINLLTKNNKEISKYDEKEIIDNKDLFLEKIVSKSLFNDERFYIISRASDKILKIIEEITNKNIEDISIIINAETLEKKSKLRSFFEKNKKYLCMPVYPDNEQTLSKLSSNFLKKKKIEISQLDINNIINKVKGDRGNLLKELKKIENYCANGKKINTDVISKLINLSENHTVNELTNNCLIKNKKKISNIFNENNFTNDDCILITRTLLNKSKNLLKLSQNYTETKNIERTISSASPPIFWKDKDNVKLQIAIWSPKKIKELIYKLNDLELLIKKNINNSLNLTTNFILDECS